MEKKKNHPSIGVPKPLKARIDRLAKTRQQSRRVIIELAIDALESQVRRQGEAVSR